MSASETFTFEEEKTSLQNELESIHLELRSLQEKREHMLQSTIEEINRERKNWEIEKDVLVKQAHEEGYQAGFQEGKTKGQEHFSTKIKQINELVDLTTTDYYKTLEQSEQVIIDLSIHTAERIIKEELDHEPNRFLAIVTAAIQEIKDQSMISIFVHPSNYEFLVKQKKELKNAVDGDTNISIYMDQKMTENECLIEHPFGQIDASIDTQLQQIREALYQVSMEKES